MNGCAEGGQNFRRVFLFLFQLFLEILLVFRRFYFEVFHLQIEHQILWALDKA